MTVNELKQMAHPTFQQRCFLVYGTLELNIFNFIKNLARKQFIFLCLVLFLESSDGRYSFWLENKAGKALQYTTGNCFDWLSPGDVQSVVSSLKWLTLKICVEGVLDVCFLFIT